MAAGKTNITLYPSDEESKNSTLRTRITPKFI
jgi:hypothetical protein